MEDLRGQMAVTESPNAVLTKYQAASMLNLSHWTLDAMHKRGEGPKRLQLSARRAGYRMRDIQAWLESRETAAA